MVDGHLSFQESVLRCRRLVDFFGSCLVRHPAGDRQSAATGAERNETPTSPKGKGNTKKTSYKRPSKAPGSTSKEKPRRSTSSGQAGLEKPSKSSRYTFARRVEPKPEVSKAWWTSLHEAFDKVVKDKVKAPSKLEDGFYVFLVVLLKKGDLKTSNNNNSEGEQVSPRKHNN